jgi:hypothetical protein
MAVWNACDRERRCGTDDHSWIAGYGRFRGYGFCQHVQRGSTNSAVLLGISFDAAHSEINDAVTWPPLRGQNVDILKASLRQAPTQVIGIETSTVPLGFVATVKQPFGNPVHPMQFMVKSSFGIVVSRLPLGDRLNKNIEIGNMDFDHSAAA